MKVFLEMERAGISKKESCQILTFPRSTFYRKEKKEKLGLLTKADDDTLEKRRSVFVIFNKKTESCSRVNLLQEIEEIIKAHPFWGYRRVWAYLKYQNGFLINVKRILRLMKENGLMNKVKKFKPVRETRRKAVATKPNEFWGTDMTKFLIPSIGWVDLVIVLDWYTKKILGHSIGLIGNTDLWLGALNNAVLEAFPLDGSKEKSVKLILDNGSQPTSKRYMKDCKIMGIEQIFTTYNNPKGNADTERCIRTVKEEAVWPYEFESLDEAREKINEMIKFYNEQYCHSSIGYKSPEEFLKEYNKKFELKLAA